MGLSKEISGGLLRISLDQAQLEIGRDIPLLQEDFKAWGFLLTPNLWIGSLWEFCDEYGIYLEAERFKPPEIQRDNDRFIMQLFEDHFNFTGMVQERQQQWMALNCCRLSLQVLFLSDIASGDGTCLERVYFHYHGTAARPLPSQWEWPQQQPTKGEWDLWLAAMRQVTVSSTGVLDRRLHLGPWIREPHQHRPWRYDPTGGYLYEHKKDQHAWKCYRPESSHHTTRRQYFVPDTIITNQHLPPNMQMAATLPTPTPQWMEMTGSAPTHLLQPYQPKTIMAAIIDLGPWGWPLRECNWDWASDLALGIQLGTALAVGDGSYMPECSKELATSAWIMQKEVDSRKQCLGECLTSGTIDEVNAYRAELHGVHSLLLALTVLCRVYELKTGSITVACDNNNTVYHTNNGHLDISSSVKHVDLVRAIRRLRNELPITVIMVEVNGHQDKIMAFDNLSPLEKLNCLADYYDAKSLPWKTIRESPPTDSPPIVPNHIYGEGIRCIIGGIKVTGNPKNAIADHMFQEAIANELDRKGTLSYSAFGYVNWDAMDSALAHRSPSFCTWVTKHVTGECRVGRKMLRWKLWDTDACPCCKTADETTTHYPYCKATDMMTAYDTAVEDFSAWMKEADTDPCIDAFFYSVLKDRSFPPAEENWIPDVMLTATEEQIAIGWNNILFGRLSTKWMRLQKLYLTSKHSRKSPECWAADMTYRLLKISHQLWTTRNGILHERDEHGLLLAEGQKLDEAIIDHYGRARPRSCLKMITISSINPYSESWKCQPPIDTLGLVTSKWRINSCTLLNSTRSLECASLWKTGSKLATYTLHQQKTTLMTMKMTTRIPSP
jgi:hypothetical protein